MVNDIINNLKERSDRFEQWIFLNISDAKATKAASEYFKIQEESFRAIIKLAQIDLATSRSINLENESLDILIKNYKINKVFNKKKADADYEKGLKLILRDNKSYNGVFFK